MVRRSNVQMGVQREVSGGLVRFCFLMSFGQNDTLT